MPGGAASQLPPFEQQHVAAAAFREMIGDAAADDAAAGDHHAGVGREARHFQNPAIASRSISAIESMSGRLAMKAGAMIAVSPVVFTCSPRS